MNSYDQFLGIVQLEHFQILAPDHLIGESVRLTRIQMQESVPPESRELALTEYEGQATMVRGHYGGGWIYSAEVIDLAGPILTAVVQKVFGQPS
jgi:hypothetical protein